MGFDLFWLLCGYSGYNNYNRLDIFWGIDFCFYDLIIVKYIYCLYDLKWFIIRVNFKDFY